MQQLELEYGNIPLLVHTDLEIVDSALQPISPSMWEYENILPYKNTFNRLLIQNTITGCTAMINRALAKKSSSIPNSAIMHDWWLGLVASQFGQIGYISMPTIKYRQHARNTIGVKRFRINLIWITCSVLYRLFGSRQEYLKSLMVNIEQADGFLKTYDDVLSDSSKNLLRDFITLPQKNWLQRRLIIIRRRLWKQGVFRNLLHIISV